MCCFVKLLECLLIVKVFVLVVTTYYSISYSRYEIPVQKDFGIKLLAATHWEHRGVVRVCRDKEGFRKLPLLLYRFTPNRLRSYNSLCLCS